MENKSYSVRYTPSAYEDLAEIDDYIAGTLGNISAADRLLAEIRQAIEQLSKFPRLGAKTDDPYLASKGYRKILVRNYLIFYLVNSADRMVLIMRIIYGAREYRGLL